MRKGTRCAEIGDRSRSSDLNNFDLSRALSRLALSSLIFSSIVGYVACPSAEAAEEIRVRLDSVRSDIALSGVELRFPGAPQKRLSVYQALRIKWAPAGSGLTAWTLEDRDSGEVLARVRAKTLDISGSSLRLNLKPLPGRLTLRPSPSSQVADVISSVDLETYVRGVLPAEMPRTWPLEALKAQAVAARTFALFRKQSREKANAPYHLEATVMDQVYLVPVVEEGGDESQARVEQAVRETKDLVLLADGSIGSQGEPQPIPAHFHADCGGRTEDARVVWGYKESMGTTVDGSCPLNPLARWKVGFTGEELARKLRGQGLLARGLAKLEAITPFSFTASGRVSQLRLQWSDGESTFISAHDFRMRVGHDRVKSTNFTVERSGPQGEFQIAGQGFGHGVGLCQWGARQLAQSGKDFREILGHYYPKARVTGWEQARDGVVTGIASSEDEIKRRRRL